MLPDLFRNVVVTYQIKFTAFDHFFVIFAFFFARGFLYNFQKGLLHFSIFHLILGTFVVYKEYQPNYDPKQGKYCNRTAYLLAFWILTFQYTLLGIFILLSACYMLMKGDFKKI